MFSALCKAFGVASPTEDGGDIAMNTIGSPLSYVMQHTACVDPSLLAGIVADRGLQSRRTSEESVNSPLLLMACGADESVQVLWRCIEMGMKDSAGSGQRSSDFITVYDDWNETVGLTTYGLGSLHINVRSAASVRQGSGNPSLAGSHCFLLCFSLHPDRFVASLAEAERDWKSSCSSFLPSCGSEHCDAQALLVGVARSERCIVDWEESEVVSEARQAINALCDRIGCKFATVLPGMKQSTILSALESATILACYPDILPSPFAAVRDVIGTHATRCDIEMGLQPAVGADLRRHLYNHINKVNVQQLCQGSIVLNNHHKKCEKELQDLRLDTEHILSTLQIHLLRHKNKLLEHSRKMVDANQKRRV